MKSTHNKVHHEFAEVHGHGGEGVKEHHIGASERRASATVVVGGKPKFPMPDKAHARNALARENQAKPPLTPGQKAKVESRAHRILGDK